MLYVRLFLIIQEIKEYSNEYTIEICDNICDIMTVIDINVYLHTYSSSLTIYMILRDA